MFPSCCCSTRGWEKRRRVDWHGAEANGAGEEASDSGSAHSEKAAKKKKKKKEKKKKKKKKKKLGQTNWFCESVRRTGAGESERVEDGAEVNTLLVLLGERCGGSGSGQVISQERADLLTNSTPQRTQRRPSNGATVLSHI
ncbi:hypothetical protein EYF80_015468 [Liparis tanakae]|uniref:Uncharacterized protein n=1 Tax=Liparis tanakae TaxID=230148 RepID=A0A4Z2I9Z4_9TELE|nr:hypothetical protein EYF80_015468 [Liparis tanakae]